MDFIEVFISAIIVGLIVIIAIAIKNEESIGYRVVCDSGFETPVSNYAGIKHSVIEWQEVVNGSWSNRRMTNGEICKGLTIKKGE